MVEHRLTRPLTRRLQRGANPKTRAWWERYLRGTAAFRGVPLPAIRSAVHAWWHAERIAERCTPHEQHRLALSLLRHRSTEDKLAAMLLIQEILLPSAPLDWTRNLRAYGQLFSRQAIADWNSCDWFSVKVLGTLIRRFGRPCALVVGGWRNADNLWQRRASAVAFVNLAKDGEANFPGFTSIVLRSCKALVGHPERFAQTGAAWVLRELGRADTRIVENFLARHRRTMSAETLRSATQRLPSGSRRRILALEKRKAPARTRARRVKQESLRIHIAPLHSVDIH